MFPNFCNQCFSTCAEFDDFLSEFGQRWGNVCQIVAKCLSEFDKFDNFFPRDGLTVKFVRIWLTSRQLEVRRIFSKRFFVLLFRALGSELRRKRSGHPLQVLRLLEIVLGGLASAPLLGPGEPVPAEPRLRVLQHISAGRLPRRARLLLGAFGQKIEPQRRG